LGIGAIMSLSKVYYDSKHAAGFGSVAKLVKASKKKKRNVEEWLSGQDTYTLHKPARKRFPRSPYTVTNIDIWEMDLADLSSLSRYNDKHKYLLNVIDIFSRYALSVPRKEKTGTSITAGLKSLFQNRKPITIQSKVQNLLMQIFSSTKNVRECGFILLIIPT
jgi:hypothetical protein